MVEKQSSLLNILDATRFERALEVTASLAEHRALLTTAELARLNNIITGVKDDIPTAEEPWRFEPTTVTLPSGKEIEVSLIKDPVLLARELLHNSTEAAEAGHPIDAGVDIYVGLVLAHVFKKGNRRTAVMAADYFFRRYEVPVSATAIHDMGLADLRQEGQVDFLRETIRRMASVATP